MRKSIFKQIITIYLLLSLCLVIVIALFFINAYPSDSAQPLNELLGDLWLLLLLVFGIALIVFGIFIDKIVRPIRHLTKVVSLMNAKKLDVPIFESSDNEIGELTSQFKQMRESLKQSFNDLEKTKRDLISNVSHELKTPLTTINGFVETMLNDKHTDEQKNYLQIIKRNTDRLIYIINDLLTLSKLENSTEIVKQKIDIKTLFGDIEALFSDNIKKQNITLHFEYPPNIPPLYADEFMLSQAIINLIDNAIKYSGSDKITISVEPQSIASQTQHTTPTTHFIIKVSDNGIGIPTKHLDRIFERFYVVDKSRSKRAGGTGLGLSIVKHIINLHNGDVSIQSKENTGTTFTLVLPNN